MNIDLTVNSLRAAMHCVAVKDVRYDLNGVCIQVSPDGMCHVISTNGHILFASRQHAQLNDAAPAEPVELIIPAHTVKSALRDWSKKLYAINLRQNPDGKCQLGNVLFDPVDERFPDWKRATPKTVSGASGKYNPDYLAECYAALRDWSGIGKGKTCLVNFGQNGETSAAIMTYGDDAYCVIMPWRGEESLPVAFIHEKPELEQMTA